MVPYLGNISLWITLFLSICQIIYSNKKNLNKNKKKLKIIVNSLFLFILISFFSLLYAHIISDFTLTNVYQNSHTSKPLIYKISGVWGNHEGSMLLWILVLIIFNFFIFKFLNHTNHKLILKALQTQAAILFGFILFTILTSNPFELMPYLKSNGLGFNPILQDPALAIHPPLLYIGYVGFSAVFSLSIGTLCLNENEKIPWWNYIKPFVLTSWTFLTIGITIGSIWAYYELGWGGWWFWDPVENASFMPWLLGTALLHSVIIVEKKKSLQAWVLFLSILTFLLSVIGTFLVRSGILTSVHTFALDPSRGIYILIFIAILGGYSLIVFIKESKKYFDNDYFVFLSKEGSILLNNILMVVVCSTVFLGTIYPLLIEVFSNNKIFVGEPYYNSTVIPILIPAILVMGVAPILSWGKIDKIKTLQEIFPSILTTILMTVFIFLIYKSYTFLGIFGILLAFWIISNNVILFVRKKRNCSLGMIVAHLGIGFLILGITGSSIWQEEKIIKMEIKSSTQINKYSIVFDKINEVEKSNYLAIQGDFIIYDKDKNFITKLSPENRYYPITNIFTTEASIHTNIFRDLYIVLGKGDLKEGWVVRIYNNPLVIWIWIGALTIFIGGIVSIKNNLKKIKYYNA